MEAVSKCKHWALKCRKKGKSSETVWQAVGSKPSIEFATLLEIQNRNQRLQTRLLVDEPISLTTSAGICRGKPHQKLLYESNNQDETIGLLSRLFG